VVQVGSNIDVVDVLTAKDLSESSHLAPMAAPMTQRAGRGNRSARALSQNGTRRPNRPTTEPHGRLQPHSSSYACGSALMGCAKVKTWSRSPCQPAPLVSTTAAALATSIAAAAGRRRPRASSAVHGAQCSAQRQRQRTRSTVSRPHPLSRSTQPLLLAGARSFASQICQPKFPCCGF
jgi:hypothetical protein